jgi:hypothetical protein
MLEGIGLIYRILDRKYGFDDFNDWFFAAAHASWGAGSGAGATWRPSTAPW